MQESKNTLWDNPYINSARKNMSKEDIDRYAKLGESMFEIDFEKTGNSSLPGFMKDSLLEVFESLKSGQHPSTLNTDEINILKEGLGEIWYEIFGYCEGDLKDFVTLEPKLLNVNSLEDYIK
jgi:hypothetical protein